MSVTPRLAACAFFALASSTVLAQPFVGEFTLRDPDGGTRQAKFTGTIDDGHVAGTAETDGNRFSIDGTSDGSGNISAALLREDGQPLGFCTVNAATSVGSCKLGEHSVTAVVGEAPRAATTPAGDRGAALEAKRAAHRALRRSFEASQQAASGSDE